MLLIAPELSGVREKEAVTGAAHLLSQIFELKAFARANRKVVILNVYFAQRHTYLDPVKPEALRPLMDGSVRRPPYQAARPRVAPSRRPRLAWGLTVAPSPMRRPAAP